MRTGKRILIVSLCAVLALALLGGCGGGQPTDSRTPAAGDGAPAATADPNWPAKTIQIVVPYDTGGTPDILMRAYAQHSELPLVVSNMPGSSGMVGSKYVQNAQPDGYTFLAMMPETMLTLYYGGDSGLHPSEFEWVGCMAATYMAMATNPDSGLQTWDDMVRYARENPGTLTVTSSGSKSVGETLMHILNEFYDIEMVWVPQASTVDARTAVMGRHCDAILGNTDDVANYVASGDLTGIFIAMDEPHPIMAEVPLLKDLTGDETMVYGTSRGIQAPKGTPQEIMDLLYEDMYSVSQMPAFQQALEDVGLLQKQLDSVTYTQIYLDMDPIMEEIWTKYK